MHCAKFFLCLGIACLSLLLSLPAPASAERVVRVGWFNYSTLSTYQPASLSAGQDAAKDSSALYGGYNYEYLRMISQINGWKLQFIYGTIQDSLTRLEHGDVDLVGGVGKIPAREKKFIYPVNSALKTSIALIARADNTRFSMNDFDNFQGMRVGVVTDSNPFFQAQRWSRQRHIHLQFIPFASFPQMYAALDAGKVDAVADSLLTPIPNRKILASMESQGVYFIGNKNNPQLMQELDDAMTLIQYLKPGYQESLAAKYLYSQAYNSTFSLNPQEKAYLETLKASQKPLRVAFEPDWIPIEAIDPATGAPQGIMADVFNHISQVTGLKFQYVRLNQTNPQDIDILASISTDFAWADLHQMYLSQSLFEVPIFMITNADQKNQQTIALLKNSHLAKSVTERLKEKGSEIKYLTFNTVNECLNAVKSGTAGRTYINAYELNFYMNQDAFINLKIQPVPGFSEPTSIGISKKAAPLLFSIICQALRSIPPDELIGIILKNTISVPRHRPIDFFYAHPIGSLLTVSLLVLLLGGTSFFYYSNKKNKRLREQMEAILKSQISLLQANKELNHLSHYDALTEIPNRRGLQEFLSRIYDHSSSLILAIMDIDDFKKFNDTYGHLTGDKALQQVARILEHFALSSGAFTARFGGEEFIWVDTLNTPEEAHKRLEEIRHTLLQKNFPIKKRLPAV